MIMAVRVTLIKVWRVHVVRLQVLCGLSVTKRPLCPYHHHEKVGDAEGPSTEGNSSCSIQETRASCALGLQGV